MVLNNFKSSQLRLQSIKLKFVQQHAITKSIASAAIRSHIFHGEADKLLFFLGLCSFGLRLTLFPHKGEVEGGMDLDRDLQKVPEIEFNIQYVALRS